MKIFVISLKDSERRKSFQTQMKKLNLSFEYFDAINGKELSSE
jgi:GR25 family glycosyltransferase involved in LPS biosynthesis